MSSQIPYAPDSLFHVTIASELTTNVASSRDEVSAPATQQHELTLPQTHPLNSNAGRSVSKTIDPALLKVIDDVACSESRTQAIECIVKNLALLFPSSSVRCAMGTSQIRRFYDHRLAWLGPQSNLRIEGESRWKSFCERDTVAIDHNDLSNDETKQIETLIFLPQPEGDGRCVVWMTGPERNTGGLNQFGAILPVLQNIFWRRPRISTPQVLSRLGSKAKLYCAIALASCILIAIWPTHYPVACTARVEPLHQRLVCAPFEATLLESNARPGDVVRQGQSLAVLDGRPLRLELESAKSEMLQATKEHDVALATGQIADAQQFSLQRQRLSRKIDMIHDRLARLTLVSPIDGVVVSGELDRFIGASLELGQTIMEVAPLDQMAIEIEIPEHEIAFVQAGSPTRVRLGSMGGPSIRQPLNDLYPSAEIRDDRNVFVGRILIDNPERHLRPGIRGHATAYGPLRPLAWSWVRGGWERALWWLGY